MNASKEGVKCALLTNAECTQEIKKKQIFSEIGVRI